ncbi:nucleotide exchange factor GrpE [Candidatus Woesearchaeota archaeon]|nr:nucleotide exchange factor GrpE [Candidatus Woesearchaeota archaeon]
MAKTEKKEEVKKPKQEDKELLHTLQRVQADFENYKKRVEKEMLEFRVFANANLIENLLPVLDNFDLAMKAEQNHEDFVKGVQLIFAELTKVMKDAGLKEMEAKEKFDPCFHEAMMTGQDESKEDNAIIEVFQKGYMLGDKVLRHAKVKVNKLG